MSRLITLVCLIAAVIADTPATAEDRLALVIGNAGYQNVSALDNPVNDARLMERTLREAGFTVTTLVEADRAGMIRAVEQFGRDLRAAQPGALALFYFAGHGVRSDGFNYLVPLGVNIRAESDLARETVAAEWVLEQIEAPGVTSVMVLDACRNNPFDGRGPGAIPELGDGLARMTAQNSNLIAYATGPGDVALDGAGENSPYTAALVRAIETPGLDIEAIFVQVRDEVVAATGGQQTPWESSSLEAAVFMQPDLSASASWVSGGDPSDGPLLRLGVTFTPGRWGGGALGCNTFYRYAPVSLAAASGRPRRLGAINGDGGVALELSASPGADGLEVSIVPISATGAGRPVTARLAEITPGSEYTLYTRSRHPELFGCGPMTVFLSRDR